MRRRSGWSVRELGGGAHPRDPPERDANLPDRSALKRESSGAAPPSEETTTP
jgi:hypothetical protein